MTVPLPAGARPAQSSASEQRRWLQAAAQAFMHAQDHQLALSCFVRLEDWENAAQCCERRQDWPQAADFYGRLGRLPEQARCLERAGRWAEAAEAHLALEQVERAALCFEQAGQLRRAGELYRQCGQPERAATMFRRNGDMRAAAECYEEAEDFLQAGIIWEEHLQDYAHALALYERCSAREGTAAALDLTLRRLRCLRELRRHGEERRLRGEVLQRLRTEDGWTSVAERVGALRRAGKFFVLGPGAEAPGRSAPAERLREEEASWCRDDLAKEFYELADQLGAAALDRRERQALLEEYRSRFEHDRALWLELADRISDLAAPAEGVVL